MLKFVKVYDIIVHAIEFKNLGKVGLLMELNLDTSELFASESLIIDKPVNFIFGKNGTGKSTITKLIKNQITDKDVRAYQGVESVAIDGKLNSVILGDENIAAQSKINKYDQEIAEINKSKEENLTQLSELIDKLRGIKSERDLQNNKIKKFYTDSARKIKNYGTETGLFIASPSYNSPLFEEEKRYAFHLSEDEKKLCIENVKVEEKIAIKVDIIDVDFNELLTETNKLLTSKVDEETRVVRLSSSEKINFAEVGYKIHKKGDSCSFCGNEISDTVFDELEVFFSASKIQAFKDRIQSLIIHINTVQDKLEKLHFDIDSFYNSYQSEVKNLSIELGNLFHRQNIFLDQLVENLNLKLRSLFSESDSLLLEIPDSSNRLIQQFNKIVEQNNSSDFVRIKNFSKDLLRFDLIFTYMEQFDLRNENKKLVDLEQQISILEKRKGEVEDVDNNFESQIIEKKEKIKQEVAKTRSEVKLAENINKKLELYVSFRLEHNGNQNNGFYRIKNLPPFDTTYRDIDTLSEGERNIIGFLYFIEKINEVNEDTREKIIIFDDPMDSNDDTMQYIIVTELQELMRKIDKGKTSDTLLIMTHNSHFYINVRYNRLYKDGKDRNGRDKLGDRFIRLQKSNSKTEIKILNSEGEDFATNYELLWKELRFLYDNDKPNLMLNSIRRIIETYTKFNRTDNFYNDNKEAQKLFNVNSHSIDDLEAELNGKSKEQIIDLMRSCFNSNGAKNHFKTHWKSSQK